MTADAVAGQALFILTPVALGLGGWQIVGSWIVRVRQGAEPS